MTLDLLGVAAFGQRDYATARLYHEESLAPLEELKDKKGMAECLPGLAERWRRPRDNQNAQRSCWARWRPCSNASAQVWIQLSAPGSTVPSAPHAHN